MLWVVKLASGVGFRRLFKKDQLSWRSLALGQTLRRCRNNIGPVGLACLLGAGLVLEVGWNLRATTNAPDVISPKLASNDGAKSVQEAAAPEIGSWTAIALARPLFTPSRSPFVSEIAAELPTLPRLTGTMISSGQRLCIFSGMNGSIIVREGDYLGIFKVLSVASNGVYVSGPAGTVSLSIHYDPNQVARNTTTPELTAQNDPNSDVDFTGSDSWPAQLQATR